MSTNDIVDASVPVNCTFGRDIDDYIRENREALNTLYAMLSPFCESATLLAGDNTIDVLRVGRMDLSVGAIAGSYRVLNLTNPADGQMLILKHAPGTALSPVTVVNSAAQLLLYDEDLDLWPSDWVCLRYCPSGVWQEFARTLVRHPPGLSTAYRLGVNSLGAVTAEVL